MNRSPQTLLPHWNVVPLLASGALRALRPPQEALTARGAQCAPVAVASRGVPGERTSEQAR